ncbi:MAG: peptide deformylase [Boseongicola sp.]|nr:MAG: peptide deformylase [Boseongicola sp.]
MKPRPILQWPDKRLRTPASPVESVTDEIRLIWKEMVHIMNAMPGYGLAAPQIGVMQRLAVVDCSDERGRSILLANPEIIERSETEHVWPEASPNLPGVSAVVHRPDNVLVSFTNHEGLRVTERFQDLWATSVQHQIDHLNGQMFFDRLSRTKRQMLLKKAGKPSR